MIKDLDIQFKNVIIDDKFYINRYKMFKNTKKKIKKLEDKHKVFKENKEYYIRYYTFYGHSFKNKLPNKEYYYTENNLLINCLKKC